MTTIAIIGLGEEAILLAGTLHGAGAHVIGFDVNVPPHCPVPVAKTMAEALLDADVVLSLNSPTASLRVAEQAAQLMKKGAIFADLNRATPSLKRKLDTLFPEGNFVDLDFQHAHSGDTTNVTLSASGKAAQAIAQILTPALAHINVISDTPGDAATRQLLRGLLSKGMAGVIIDFLWAAETLGLEEWAWKEIRQEFEDLNEATAQKYLSETALDFKPRQMELLDVVEMLTEAGYESTIAAPIQFNYGRIMHGKKIPYAEETSTEGTWTQPPRL